MVFNKLKFSKFRLIFLSCLAIFIGLINVVLFKYESFFNKTNSPSILSTTSGSVILSLNPAVAKVPSDTTIQLMANSNMNIAFISTQINFNPKLVKLTKEPLISGPLTKIIKVTPMSQANSNGIIKIIIALDPVNGQTSPLNSFSLASLTFGSVTSRATTTNISINSLKTEVVDINANPFSALFSNTKLYINKSIPIPTLVPTIRPTSTPTLIPTIKPTIIPTNIPTNGPTNIPTITPTTSPVNNHWTPTIGAQWQWQLSSPIDTSINVPVYDIDGFDNSASVVADLHAKGAKVICYFSAGSAEDWRSDYSSFPASVKGRSNGWAGEVWLDIRNWEVLGPIMKKRMDMCKAKGFDAIEPDNIDGYTNSTGFTLTANDQLTYNKNLAAYAHSIGLSIGLKNDVEQISALQPYFDWALNEQCFRYNECDGYSAFINAGKAVLNVEYDLSTSQFCPQAISMKFSSMKKNLDLDAYRVPCQ